MCRVLKKVKAMPQDELALIYKQAMENLPEAKKEPKKKAGKRQERVSDADSHSGGWLGF